ncbi:hypothetical protein Agub_g663 [Astrephomene gubernaculifera]|uniref:Uncharacterized protein n=1 Tax=Astrephomene gubernaculifera TaxID=47775 RepID=A0AAD3DE18_9CHLO|nr:hypothetical protein Agub_g663 [Astrephomene gubernaculifera]
MLAPVVMHVQWMTVSVNQHANQLHSASGSSSRELTSCALHMFTILSTSPSCCITAAAAQLSCLPACTAGQRPIECAKPIKYATITSHAASHHLHPNTTPPCNMLTPPPHTCTRHPQHCSTPTPHRFPPPAPAACPCRTSRSCVALCSAINLTSACTSW